MKDKDNPTYRHFDEDRADSIREHHNDQDDQNAFSMDLTQCKSVEEYRSAAHFWQKKWKEQDSATAALRREVEEKTVVSEGLGDALDRTLADLDRLTAQLATVTKERDELIVAFNTIGEAIGPITLEAASLVMTLTERAVASIEQIKASRDTALARAEAVEKVLALDQPYPLRDVLQTLTDAAKHLLDDHNCDQHGHEGIREAILAADRIRAAIDAAGGTGK
jgi:hypothetical protein